MKIWFDMTNSPHVPLFKPIIRDLQNRGHEVVVTARDYAQTLPLLEQAGIPYHYIGTHQGGKLTKKIMGLAARSFELYKFAGRAKPDVAVSHGSNDLAVSSFLRRIPHLTMFDYEHIGAHHINFRLATKILRPEVVPVTAMRKYGGKPEKILGYRGVKEDIYAAELNPDFASLAELGVKKESILVTLRPPATLAHYQANENKLFDELIGWLGNKPNVTCIVVPRTPLQAQEIKGLNLQNIIIPAKALDGLNLIYWSDVVISAGGTMNREAAALGVPVFTVYKGVMGAVDLDLMAKGKMQLINSPGDFAKLPLNKRTKLDLPEAGTLVAQISGVIESIKEEHK